MTCHEMAAADPAALLALSRRLVDFDLTSEVKVEPTWTTPCCGGPADLAPPR